VLITVTGLSVTSPTALRRFPIPQPVIDQRRLFRSDNQTDGGVLVVTSLAEGKKVAGDLMDLEPILRDGNLSTIESIPIGVGF